MSDFSMSEWARKTVIQIVEDKIRNLESLLEELRAAPPSPAVPVRDTQAEWEQEEARLRRTLSASAWQIRQVLRNNCGPMLRPQDIRGRVIKLFNVKLDASTVHPILRRYKNKLWTSPQRGRWLYKKGDHE
jgi:hypothetical protein